MSRNRKRKEAPPRSGHSSMLDGMFHDSYGLPPEEERVCQECGRLYYEGFDTQDNWLIELRRYEQRHRTQYVEWVVRCPQHITEWSLRVAGRGRSTFQKKLADEAKARDAKGFIPQNPYNMPYPPRESWSGR